MRKANVTIQVTIRLPELEVTSNDRTEIRNAVERDLRQRLTPWAEDIQFDRVNVNTITDSSESSKAAGAK